MNGDGYSSRQGGRHGGSSRDYQSSRHEGRDRDRDRPRRRSRSPEFRSGRTRRDGDGAEIDNYSSSRSHREREREDRHSGRDHRRGGERERDWDRDRAPRRQDGRRGGGPGDDDRRARDPTYEERGGRSGRRGDRDRDRDVDRERRRSATPPPKKREPTPDLTDVVPVLERKRRLTQWDLKPPGYENVTAEQAKLSGMFPLPGAPRQQAMDPTRLQAFMNQPSGSVNNAALRPTNSRQSKRLLLTNLPPGATEENILAFINLQLNGLNVVDSTDPCIMCQVSSDHSFAMLEFRTSADATVALAFDGITMEADDDMDGKNGDTGSKGIVIRRPRDYIVPAVVDDVPYQPGVVSSIVVDTPHKISIAKIPAYLTEEQVVELLVSFGELKAFVLVKDSGTDESRGIAFCEYVDPSATEIAIQGLNGMDIGPNRLKVQKASSGIAQVAGEMGVNAMSMLAGTTSQEPDLSRVVQLLNMVTPEELMDQQDYEEIKEDVEEECSKFGEIVKITIPRPVGGSRQSAGVGKIFVKFAATESATKALRALAGRKFADRTVVTTYFPEENFEVEAW